MDKYDLLSSDIQMVGQSTPKCLSELRDHNKIN